MSLYHLSEEIKKWTADEIMKRLARTADEAIDYRKYFSIPGFFEDYLEDYVKLTIDEVQSQQDPSASPGSGPAKDDRAIKEQKKADEKMLRLTEKQKKQKELLHKKIIKLEAKLDQKQELELQRIRGAIKVIKHMMDEDKAKLKSVEEELRDKEEEYDGLESLNQALFIKERKTNDELEEARNQLINDEMAIMEQKKAEEKLLKLAEEQKGEKELLQKKIIELEAKLDQKQAQIERMMGDIEVMKHTSDDLKSLNQQLTIKERRTNDELQEARRQLINGLRDSRANICVKRMGELDRMPFIKAAEIQYGSKNSIAKGTGLHSLWEDQLRDLNWHPYKVVMLGGTSKEVVDENDENLKELKTELGGEVYEAVTRAMNELNEYNPSGRYPVPELWNSNKNTKVSLKEGIDYVLKQWEIHKAKWQKY